MSQKDPDLINLGIIDGVRTLTCGAIVLFHVNYFCCHYFVLSDSETMRNLLDSYPLVFEPSVQMSIFWAISGFLCSSQLDRLRTASSHQYFCFGINRILRLYPLYFLYATLIYLFASTAPNHRNMEKGCNATDYLQTLLFAIPIRRAPVTCLGPGWSVVVDVHGYIFLMALFFTFQNDTIRKSILGAGVLVATWRMHLTWISIGSRHGNDLLQQAKYFGFDTLIDAEKWFIEEDIESLYPDFNFNADSLTAMKEVRVATMEEAYFTGLLNHGTAILAGSFLYLDLKRRHGEPRNAILQLSIAFSILYLTNGLFSSAAIPVVLILDVLLVTRNTYVVGFLSNSIWKFLAPYTYGIYFFHISLMLNRGTLQTLMETGIENNGTVAACAVSFLLPMACRIFFETLVLSIVLYHTVELPFNLVRKKYVRPIVANYTYEKKE